MHCFGESLYELLQFACPVFVPSLLVFAYHSPLSLRVWYAVQDAPIYLSEDDSSLPHHWSPGNQQRSCLSKIGSKLNGFGRRFNVVASIAPVWLSATLAIGTLLQSSDRTIAGLDLDMFFTYAMFPVILFATSRLFSTLFGVEIVRVLLDTHGYPFFRSSIRKDIEPILAFAPYAAAGLVAYRSVVSDDWLSLSVAYGATLHFLISMEITNIRSFKTSFLCAVVNLTTMIICISTLFAPDAFRSVDDFLYAVKKLSENPRTSSHWPLFIISVLWTIFPAELIALSYRFDYHNHLAKLVLSLPADEDFIDSTDSRKARLEGEAPPPSAPLLPIYDESASLTFQRMREPNVADDLPLLIPVSSSSTCVSFSPEPTQSFGEMNDADIGSHVAFMAGNPVFPAPHFFGAITSWILCTVALYGGLLYTGSDSAVEFHYIEALLTLLSMPTMVVSVLSIALFTGGWSGLKRLWHYSESWSKREVVRSRGYRIRSPEEYYTDEKVAL